MNTITLGGKTVYGAPARDGINWFEFHSGASRAGVGMFLMLKSDVDSLLAGSPVSVSLVITDGTTGGPSSGTITLPVFIGGMIPFTTIPSPSGSTTPQPTDMVRVIVFDQRRVYTTPINKVYNVIQQPLGFTSGDFVYFKGSLSGGSTPWNWTNVMSDAGLPGFSGPPTAPSWKPRNLIFDGAPINRVLDDIAARLWIIVGYDPTASTPGGGVKLYNPSQQSTGNVTLLASALSTSRNKGQKGSRSGLAVPGKFEVTFRAGGSYADPTTNRSYTKDVMVGMGTQIQPLNIGDQLAFWNGSSFANSSDLDSIASDIAQRAYNFLNSTRAEYEFIGLWNFTCDGYIRGVRWSSSDDKGMVTQVRIDNDEDWCAIDDLRRIIEFSDNQLIVSGSNLVVAGNSGGGAKTVYVDLGIFIVDVAWDGGGSDGTTSTRATWTYTVKRNGVTIGTALQPECNRPIGSMIQGDLVPGSTKHGEAFYGSDGTLHLWSAGEVRNTNPACA